MIVPASFAVVLTPDGILYGAGMVLGLVLIALLWAKALVRTRTLSDVRSYGAMRTFNVVILPLLVAFGVITCIRVAIAMVR